MFTFKKKSIPTKNIVDLNSCVQLWYVRWFSRYGRYHTDINAEVEAFTNEQEAKDFKSALEAAFKLLKHTSVNNVTLEKAN